RHSVCSDMESLPRLSCDVSGLPAFDPESLAALGRLQLIARRLGTSIELRNACPRLVDFLALAGLSEILPVAPGSVVEVDRLAEDREQLGVDEERDPGDAAL